MSKKKPDTAPVADEAPAAPVAPPEAAPEAAADAPPEPPPDPEPEPEPEPVAAEPLRTDGPTLEEFVAAGYRAELYPPPGYAARTEERVRYFRVKAFSKYCLNGSVYSLQEGTVVSSQSHDLKDVRAQGVPLEEISADQIPPAVVRGQ